jgi:hypothetical protein
VALTTVIAHQGTDKASSPRRRSTSLRERTSVTAVQRPCQWGTARAAIASLACPKAQRSSSWGWESGVHVKMQWQRCCNTNAHKGWVLERSSPRKGTPWGALGLACVASQRLPAVRSPSCGTCPSWGMRSSGGKAMTWAWPGHTITGVLAA